MLFHLLINIIVLLCLENERRKSSCCKYFCVQLFFCVILWKRLGYMKSDGHYYIALREVVNDSDNESQAEQIGDDIEPSDN